MVKIIMPKMGDAMEEGTLLRWLKAEGEPVKAGEVIAEIATDKATVEIEAPDSGILSGVKYPEGAVVPVGEPMAYIRSEGESLPEEGTKPGGDGQAVREVPSPEMPAAAASALPSTPTAPLLASGRLKASPLAKRLAREYGIDLHALQGTGPGGRIVERDITAYLESRPTVAPTPATPPGEVTSEPLPYLRKVIAQRMTQVKQTVPHFYLTIEVEMDEAIRLRQKLNTDESLPKISLNDMLVKASALAIQKHPIVNSYVEGETRYYPAGIHVGIAVAVPDGLLVAVVKHCEQKSLRRIAAESRELIEKARAGKLMPDEMSGNTFTVSNLGMYDIDEFVAIINPPASSIIAVGAVRKQPVVMEDDSIQVRARMKITMSCDHRVLDGATGALFLQDLKRYLQQPYLLVE